MSLVFERVTAEGLGDISYLIGDDAAGIAAVIDPLPDCDVYLQLAREHRVEIRHVIQTHIHEDFMSGMRELAVRSGNAVMHAGKSNDDPYGYAVNLLSDGDRITLGETSLTARHTPGHTPEHVSLVVNENSNSASPYAVFTGGSLLVGALGRSDLLGPERTEEMLRKEYETLTNFYLKLEDGIIIHPTHGHGSACGPQIGDRFSSTIGYERAHNPYLQFSSYSEFRAKALGDLPPKPTYYSRLKEINTKGPQVQGKIPTVPGFPPGDFQQLVNKADAAIVDTRSMFAFGGGHITGALNIGDRGELSVWAGWMLDPGQPIAIVLDKDEDIDKVTALFWRTGFTSCIAYLAGGMRAWIQAGMPVDYIHQVDVHDLARDLEGIQLVDVRAPHEWKKGHIPHARHIYLPELPGRADELDRRHPLATYCDSGYRASIASSLLLKAGFLDVRNVPGSWQAWKNAQLPVEE